MVIGAFVTIGYAIAQGRPPTVPPWTLGGALGAVVVVGTVAGLYPAVRASRLSPTVALSVGT